jgi:hypothetical protein
VVIPKFKSLNENIQRIRNKKFKSFYPVFDDIPNFLKNDLTGHTFLQFDSGNVATGRYVIFSSSFCKTYVEKLKLL